MDEDQILKSIVISLKSERYDEFDKFYQLTKRKVYFSIYSLLKDQAQSEDILQDTYVKFLQNLQSLEDGINPLGYLLKIARNCSLDYIRKRNRESFIDVYDNEDMYGGQSDSYESSSNLMDNMRKLLKDKEYEIVILHVVNDMRFQEIADHIKRPLGTVLWAYNNAIKKLKKGIKKDE
ncbi:MAG: RNA polymerase sigma factor [Bacilli bacterium]|nr:RNA polymerase sigma factor [Bacilli bacterium]